MKNISIIIPCFNVEKYIIKCLESIVSQNYNEDNYQVILVNDGSTDNTLKLVEEFIKVNSIVNFEVYSKENGGLGSARNFGMARALGKYIWFIDSDDYILPNTFETIINTAILDDLDMLWFSHILVNEEYLELPLPKADIKTGYDESIRDGKYFIENIFNKSCMVCMFLFKADFLKRNELLFMEGVFLEDILFTYKAIYKAKLIRFIDFNVYCYLIRENSIMRSKSLNEKRFYDAVKINVEINKFNNEIGRFYYFENAVYVSTLYCLRRSVKDCKVGFSDELYRYALQSNLLPLIPQGDMKSKILANLLNINFNLFKKLCRVLK